MYTLVCGKTEGFPFNDRDTLECAGIDELDSVIRELRHVGYRIFLVYNNGRKVARIDDIAASIIAHTCAIDTLRDSEG
ncbi:hypothetical protein D3C73_1626440 [compost metagenome]